jgi:hypothetical protein
MALRGRLARPEILHAQRVGGKIVVALDDFAVRRLSDNLTVPDRSRHLRSSPLILPEDFDDFAG